MIKGTTKSGFNYEVEDDRLSNYELVEALSEMETNSLIIPKIVKMILGPEQTENLKNHVRLENGTVPVKEIEKAIVEIFNAQKDLKNS